MESYLQFPYVFTVKAILSSGTSRGQVREVVVKLHGIITSVPDGGEWAVSYQGRLITEERRPNTKSVRGWVGPRPIMNILEKRKIACCCWETRHDSSVARPVA